MTRSAQLYGLQNCDSCRKARRWLDGHDVGYRFRDIRADAPGRKKIAQWCGKTGWQTLLNRRSTSWRSLPDQRKQDLDSHRAIELMNDNPTLIRRPVLEFGDRLFVGFDADAYAAEFLTR